MKRPFVSLFRSHSGFIESSIYSVFGGASSKAFTLLAMVLVARNLGSEAFGELGLISISIMLVAPFFALGLSYSTTKIIAEHASTRSDQQRIVEVSVITGGVLGVVSGFVFLVLTQAFEARIARSIPGLTFDILISVFAGTYLGTLVLVNILTGIYAGLDKFRGLAKVQVLSGIISLPLYHAMSIKFGLVGVYVAFSIANLIMIGLLLSGLKSVIQTRWIDGLKRKLRWHVLKKLIFSGFPLGLADGFYGISSWSIAVLLTLSTGVGELGLYNAASQWLMLIIFIPANMSPVVLSHLTTEQGKSGNASMHKDLFKLNLIGVSLLTLCGTVLVLAFSSFVELLYGESYVGMGHVVRLLVLCAVPIALTNLFFQSFISLHKEQMVLKLRLFSQGILLVICIFSPNLDALSLAGYKLFSSICVVFVVYLIYRRIRI